MNKNKTIGKSKQLSDCCQAEIKLTGKDRPNAFACVECGRIIGTPVPDKSTSEADLTLVILPTEQLGELLSKTNWRYVENISRVTQKYDINDSLEQIKEFYGENQ